MEQIKRITGDSIHLVSVNGDEPRTLRSIGNGGGGGTKDYNALQNLPSINGTTVQGNKTLSDYGLMTEMSSALNGKVDKVSGKDLSSNDFTNADKSKLNGIEAGAEVNVNADWNAVDGDALILNKPTIPTVPTDVSAFNNDAGYVNATQAANAAPVQSVNGQTGAVTLTIPTVPSDVSAFDNDAGYITENDLPDYEVLVDPDSQVGILELGEGVVAEPNYTPSGDITAPTLDYEFKNNRLYIYGINAPTFAGSGVKLIIEESE